MPADPYPAYTVWFRGKPACPCLAQWLPVYEKMLLQAKVIKSNLDIYQLIGGAAASGGTHALGGCFDTAQTSAKAISIAREMGAATWYRPYNWDGRKGMAHTHGVLIGCPHNGPAAYQITAQRNGYNGLGYLGQAARDTGSPKTITRDWREGVTWATKQLQPPKEWDEMASKNEIKAALLEVMKSNEVKGIIEHEARQAVDRRLGDVVPAGKTEKNLKGNPTWNPSSFWRLTYNNTVTIIELLQRIVKKIGA